MGQEPVLNVFLFFLAPAGAGVNLLGGGDGDPHPGGDLRLLGGGGPALDVRDHNGGNNGRNQGKNGLNDGGNIHVSEKLDAMIESAVYELKNGFLTIEGGLPGTP